MLTQLQTERLAWFDGRPMQRKARLLKKRALRASKTSVRRLRSRVLAWQSRQYFLATAHREVRLSAGRNEDIFIGSLIVGVVLAYAAVVVAAQSLFTFLESTYALADASGLSFLILLLMALGVIITVLFWILALASNAASISLMHGLYRRQQRSLRATLRQSLEYAPRLSAAWALSLGRILWPGALSTIGSLIVGKAHLLNHANRLSVVLGLIAVGALYSLWFLLRYSLAPQVALFEPQLPLGETFRRSARLTKRAGRLFLLTAYTGLLLWSALCYGVAWLLNWGPHISPVITLSLCGVATLLYGNALLTMLYARRRRMSNR